MKEEEEGWCGVQSQVSGHVHTECVLASPHASPDAASSEEYGLIQWNNTKKFIEN